MTSKRTHQKPKKQAEKRPYDRHELYERSVQNVEFDVEFIHDQFKALRGREPKTLREDFCGTGVLMCEWVKQGKDFIAHGYDLDPEVVEWGKNRHYAALNEDQKKRVHYHLENVLSADIKADAIVAFNFSYFIFKKRAQLLEYFKSVYESLAPGGVFFLDLFGGPESQVLQEEETEHDDFSYFWDCDQFNPITNECLFYIHFKYQGKKYRKAFTYDWRLWGLAELRDILSDAGFTKTHAYWEGDDPDDDGGDGEFYISEEEQNCDSWVTYIAAIKE